MVFTISDRFGTDQVRFDLIVRCQYDSAVMYGGFRGALNWVPLMPRDASLSDSYKSDRWRFSCLAVFLHWEKHISNSFHIEWDMIKVTVFLSILNQMEFHLVQNRKENCHLDRIPFNVKGIGCIVFSVWWNETVIMITEEWWNGTGVIEDKKSTPKHSNPPYTQKIKDNDKFIIW